MRGYQNPNVNGNLGLGACFITPLKGAVVVWECVYGPLAVV